MRRSRMVAVTGAIALATAGLGATGGERRSRPRHRHRPSSAARTIYVLGEERGLRRRARGHPHRRRGQGHRPERRHRSRHRDLDGLPASRPRRATSTGSKERPLNRSVGEAPADVKAKPDPVEKEHVFDKSRGNGSAKDIPPPPEGADPLDGLLWGHEMVNAFEARSRRDRRQGPGRDPRHRRRRKRTSTSRRTSTVRSRATSRPTSRRSTVRASTPAASTPRTSTTTVTAPTSPAPSVRPSTASASAASRPTPRSSTSAAARTAATSSSGPVVNALTYAGDNGLDVVNMSFYVDPWLYNCQRRRPGGRGEEPGGGRRAEHDHRRDDACARLRQRARRHARRGPRQRPRGPVQAADTTSSSPDYDNPTYNWDTTPWERTIDNAKCLDLPVEGPNVIGVSALGPSERKSDYSNYTTDLTSGEIEVSAPGGWFRDGFGTDCYLHQRQPHPVGCSAQRAPGRGPGRQERQHHEARPRRGRAQVVRQRQAQREHLGVRLLPVAPGHLDGLAARRRRRGARRGGARDGAQRRRTSGWPRPDARASSWTRRPTTPARRGGVQSYRTWAGRPSSPPLASGLRTSTASTATASSTPWAPSQ